MVTIFVGNSMKYPCQIWESKNIKGHPCNLHYCLCALSCALGEIYMLALYAQVVFYIIFTRSQLHARGNLYYLYVLPRRILEAKILETNMSGTPNPGNKHVRVASQTLVCTFQRNPLFQEVLVYQCWKIPLGKFYHWKNFGALEIVPLVINPVHTLYRRNLLGIYLFKGHLGLNR